MRDRRLRMGWKGLATITFVSAIAMVGAAPAGAADGDISRLAGGNGAGFSGDGGLATSAQLNGPTGVAAAADGRVFIADRANNRIRVVATDGTISTLVSDLVLPVDVAVDDANDLLYFTESLDGFVNRLSSVDISAGPAAPVLVAGGVNTGYAGDGGPGTSAVFNSIAGIDVGPNGDVYIADRQNNRIRRLDVATGFVHLFAGTGAPGGDNGDATTAATFAGPKDVAVAADGTVYVADELNHLVRVIQGGNVGVFAGNYTNDYTGDGGPATAASLHSPDGVAVAPNGDVYIADTTNNVVRHVDIGTGIIDTVAGNTLCCATGDGGPATAAAIGNPIRIDVDTIGTIWIASEPEHAIRVVEGVPIADAGGPYTIAEGDDLVLDASASVAGPTATFAWDLDGDALFDDAVGISPTIAANDLIALGLADGPAGPETISVQITEGATTAAADTTVTVTNVAPTATVGAPAGAVAGTEVSVTVGAGDAGPVDAAAPFTFQIDWDGDGTVDETVSGTSPQTVSHTYAVAGTATLTVVAVDQDGAASEPVTTTIVVSAAATTTTAAPTTTTAPTTIPTTPPTSTPSTLTPQLPATGAGAGTSTQVAIAAFLLAAGAALLATRSNRRPV